MNTAFVIFHHMTAMDFIGAYDPLTRLKSMGLMPSFEWDICALTADVAETRASTLHRPSWANHSLTMISLLFQVEKAHGRFSMTKYSSTGFGHRSP
jgi:cyclohexyl-isocyanide hydratase